MVASALMAVLPILVVYFIAVTAFSPAETYSFAAKAVISSLAFVLAASGYAILYRYPKNIMKLRQYPQAIAQGELPDKITLLQSEDDMRAIENYLNAVLDQLRSRLRLSEEQLQVTRQMKNTIESQQKKLLEVERQRVMIQSLGAACHHILKDHASSPTELEKIEECAKALDSIAEVLEKLRRVSEYRTVPYLDEERGENREILDIDD